MCFRLKSSESCPNVREQTKPSSNKSVDKPQSNLKLKLINNNKEKKSTSKKTKDSSTEEGLYDSVELSFMGK